LNADECAILKNKPNFNQLLTFSEFDLNLKTHCEKLKINKPEISESILVIQQWFVSASLLMPRIFIKHPWQISSVLILIFM
jgi:hypothetical protein